MRILILAVAISLISGCQSGIYAMNADQLQQQPTISIAEAYGNSRIGWPMNPKPFETELKRRDAFNDADWARIQKRELKPGDSMTFTYASWGPPDDALTRDGLDRDYAIWHYRDNATRPGARGYVHFTGQLVTAIDR
ncbi:MAG: hypothetical protein IPK69_11880 [Phycisphaerales bacterium]|nr:MAG: hypothetical protein IPK69_11880 [Phycisphaerales bacterium]